MATKGCQLGELRASLNYFPKDTHGDVRGGEGKGCDVTTIVKMYVLC